MRHGPLHYYPKHNRLQWRRLIIGAAILGILVNLTSPFYVTAPAQAAETQINDNDFNQIGVAVVSNLRAADDLGQFLSHEFRRRFADAPDVSLSLEVVHCGDLIDFPARASWIINHAKHTETDPATPNNIEVELRLVNEEDFRAALVQTQNDMLLAKESADQLGQSMTETIESLIQSISHIEQTSHQTLVSLDTLETTVPHPLSSSFYSEVKDLKGTIERLLKDLKEAPNQWPLHQTWINLRDIGQQLQDFSDLWKMREAMPLLQTNGSHPDATNDLISQQLDKLTQHIQQAEQLKLKLEQVALYVQYGERPKKPQATGASDWNHAASPSPSILSNIGLKLRYFLGLPDGLTWVMYKLSFTERTAKEHIVEFSSALLQAAALYEINYESILAKMASDPEMSLNPIAGAATSALWKLTTGYIERANNAFFVQGINFDPIREFATNHKFFLASGYIHSILIGLTVQLATRGVEGFTHDIVLHTAWNSFLGLFAKAVPLLLISKHQQKHFEVEDSESLHHSKWRTIFFNFVFGITYQGIKAMHFYQLDYMNLDTVFVVLGLLGLGYEVGKWFHDATREVATSRGTITRFQYKVHRFERAVTPLGLGIPKPPRTCQSLFLFPQTPDR